MFNSSRVTTDTIFPLVRAAMKPGNTPIRCNKSLLAYLSHTLEYIVQHHHTPALVYTGFQHVQHWLQEASRYETLGEVARQVWVFVVGESPVEQVGNTICIPLQDAGNTHQEWFVVVWCPPVAAMLWARDCPVPAEQESMSEFELCWSFDVALIERLLQQLEQMIAVSRPERLPHFRETQNQARRSPLAPPQAARLAAALGHFSDQLQMAQMAPGARTSPCVQGPASASTMIAHDLRTQLQSLVTALDMLGLPTFDQSRRRTFLQAAQASATQLTALVEVLFDANTLQASPFSVTWERLDLVQLARQAVQPLMPLLDAAGVKLSITIADDSSPVWGDRLLTLRVFQNLISNATRFTPPNGQITIAASEESSPLHLDVVISDTGRGMAPEQLVHLFQRSSTQEAPLPQRSGIGLLFCRLAMEAQGGTIQLGSELGVGTAVTLTFCTQHPSSRVL